MSLLIVSILPNVSGRRPDVNKAASLLPRPAGIPGGAFYFISIQSQLPLMKALTIVALILSHGALLSSLIEIRRLHTRIDSVETKLAWDIALARGAATDEVRILREDVRVEK